MSNFQILRSVGVGNLKKSHPLRGVQQLLNSTTGCLETELLEFVRTVGRLVADVVGQTVGQ